MALATILISCNRDSVDLLLGDDASNGAITFESAELTRGAVISSDDFGEMDVYAYYTGTAKFASEGASYTSFMNTQSVTRSKVIDSYEENTTTVDQWHWDTWGYSPIKYWPKESETKISFFSFTPYNAITASTDETTGLPTFTYQHGAYAGNTVDLNYCAVLDREQDDTNSAITFDLSRLMSRLSLSAKISNQPAAVTDGGVTTTKTYYINGISFFGVYDKMIYSYDSNSSSYEWTLDTSIASIDYSATQGVSLLGVESVDENGNTTYSENYLTDSDTNLCLDGTAIFVLPQSVKDITMQVRIREVTTVVDGDTTTTSEDFYSSANDIAVPTVNNAGEWFSGEWTNLTFTFDANNLSTGYVIAMSVMATEYEWTEAEVEADIHNNLYIYASSSKIDMQTDDAGTAEDTTDDTYYGEFMICTNYDYNLRMPHHRKELDGSITSSRGFLFCSNDFNGEGYADTYHVGSYEDSDGVTFKMFVPTLMSGTTEIVYATDTAVKAEGVYPSGTPIYEYVDGYGTTASEISGVTVDDITYGSNYYAFIYDSTKEIYRLLYIDPNGVDGNALTAFNYEYSADSDSYEIKLSAFADANNTVSFKIKIISGYEFDFWVSRSTRDDEDLYVSGAVSSDASYGVNKNGTDPVYILRLSVDPDHADENGDITFDDTIGVEMISNGGGMITQLFPVTLTGTVPN